MVEREGKRTSTTNDPPFSALSMRAWRTPVAPAAPVLWVLFKFML